MEFATSKDETERAWGDHVRRLLGEPEPANVDFAEGEDTFELRASITQHLVASLGSDTAPTRFSDETMLAELAVINAPARLHVDYDGPHVHVRFDGDIADGTTAVVVAADRRWAIGRFHSGSATLCSLGVDVIAYAGEMVDADVNAWLAGGKLAAGLRPTDAQRILGELVLDDRVSAVVSRDEKGVPRLHVAFADTNAPEVIDVGGILFPAAKSASCKPNISDVGDHRERVPATTCTPDQLRASAAVARDFVTIEAWRRLADDETIAQDRRDAIRLGLDDPERE
ncbi:MAG TPA: hypothetical protein VFB78_07595 [Acidimicrobiales bacterium]|nr:hypothetical protein [Acidimicrobiales bacterium]